MAQLAQKSADSTWGSPFQWFLLQLLQCFEERVHWAVISMDPTSTPAQGGDEWSSGDGV